MIYTYTKGKKANIFYSKSWIYSKIFMGFHSSYVIFKHPHFQHSISVHEVLCYFNIIYAQNQFFTLEQITFLTSPLYIKQYRSSLDLADNIHSPRFSNWSHLGLNRLLKCECVREMASSARCFFPSRKQKPALAPLSVKSCAYTAREKGHRRCRCNQAGDIRVW